MQHFLHLRDFLENLQNQRFLHPHVAGAFKTRVFRSRGGSIWSQWGGAGASVHEIHSSTTRDTTLDIRSGEGSTLRSPARCPPGSSSAEIPAKNPPSVLRILWPKDAQKAAEAGHAGKTYAIIRKSRPPAKDSTLRCNSKNPLTDLHEIRVESTGKSRRRHNFFGPRAKTYEKRNSAPPAASLRSY